MAIGCIGISYFVDDTNLKQLMQSLHDWAAPGSVVVMTVPSSDVTVDDARETLEWFKSNNAELFLRRESEIRALCAPWKVVIIKPLTEWLDVRHLMHEADYVDNTEFNGLLFEHAGS